MTIEMRLLLKSGQRTKLQLLCWSSTIAPTTIQKGFSIVKLLYFFASIYLVIVFIWKKGSKYVFTFHQKNKKNQIQFNKMSSAGKIYFQIVGYLEDIIQNCSTLQSIIWKLYIANPPGRPTVFKCPRQALICRKFNSKTFLRAIFKGRPIPGI